MQVVTIAALLAGITGVCLTTLAAETSADADRLGLLDDCASADGWSGDIARSDGQDLICEDLLRGGTIRKTYPAVDLDRYHYAVVEIPRKSMAIRIEVNGSETPLGYTTGSTAVDLRHYDSPRLRGVQEVVIQIRFVGRSKARQVVSRIALVDRLSEAEQARLAPRPHGWREEKLSAKPYHALESLMARANLPLADEHEQAIFRDTATHAITTRLTASPVPEFLDEQPCWGSFGYPWNADGSCFRMSCRGRATNLIDLHAGIAVAGPQTNRALWSPDRPDEMYVLKGRTELYVYNWSTGEQRLLCTVSPSRRGWPELWLTYKTAKVMYSMRNSSECFVIDPEAPEGRRVSSFRLRNLKMAQLGGPDEELLVWNWQRGEGIMCRDLATGRDAPGHVYSTSHSPHGRQANITRHNLYTLLYVPRELHHTFNYQPGAKVKIWANFTKPFMTDYGALTEDERWVFTNGYHKPGVTGDLFCQHLQVSADDPGTVLRLARYYSSFSDHDDPQYTEWECPTYSRQSPDYTKLAYVCDAIGNPDLWMVYTRKPDPVRNLEIRCGQDGVELSWGRPQRCKEVRHYNVYWTDTSGSNYRRINAKPVTDLSFKAPSKLAEGYFSVAAEEHCRLEGLFCEEVGLGGKEATRYNEASRCRLTPPARLVFDGRMGDFRYVRVTPLASDEKLAKVAHGLTNLPAGDYSLWLRVRGTGSWSVHLAGEAVGSVTGTGDQWQWIKLETPICLAGQQEITFTSSDVDLCLDRSVLSSSAAFKPDSPDPRDATPPAAPGSLSASAIGDGKVKLSWRKPADADLRHFSVYASDDPDFVPDNRTIIRSLHGTEIIDVLPHTGKVFYKVLAYDHRGNASEPAAAEAVVR